MQFTIEAAEFNFPESDTGQVCLCDLEGQGLYDLKGRPLSTCLQERGTGIKAELCVLNGLFEAAEKVKCCSSLPPSEEKPAQHSSLEVPCIKVKKLNMILWNMLLLESSRVCCVTLFVTEI